MYAVRSVIIFILAFSGKYVQTTSAATEDLPPCVKDSEGQDRCQNVFQCNHSVKPPVCCSNSAPIFDGEKCRTGYGGEPCTEPNHCVYYDCDTSQGECRGERPNLSTYGGHCINKNNCDPKELVCTNTKCSCPAGLKWNQTACVARGPTKTINEPCSTDDDCITERQLKCINQKCDCDPGFSWTEAICKPKSELPTCDPDVFPNECPHDSKQMECDKDQKVCRCRQDMEYSPSMKACKLKAGENCLINNTLEHDQCLSQQCGNNEKESTDHNCACHNQNGIPEIWSPGTPGSCVTNYYDFACSGSNSECRPETFNTSRQGLICKDNMCKCEEGLTYIRGYCVVANMTFGDPCDKDGVRPTCKIDADLTCRDVGGGDFRCVCLQRVMTVRGKRHTVLLTWNGAEKKCDLKSHGERCKEAIECRSGVCQETCVGEHPVPIRRSTGTTIYVYDTKVYANYIFLIISINMILTLY